MYTPDRGYENVLRSHQVIADLQALHRNQMREAAVAQTTGKTPVRSRRSIALEFQASRHGASGEAIRRAGMAEDIYARLPKRIITLNNRVSAIEGFWADLAASRATASRTSPVR